MYKGAFIAVFVCYACSFSGWPQLRASAGRTVIFVNSGNVHLCTTVALCQCCTAQISALSPITHPRGRVSQYLVPPQLAGGDGRGRTHLDSAGPQVEGIVVAGVDAAGVGRHVGQEAACVAGHLVCQRVPQLQGRGLAEAAHLVLRFCTWKRPRRRFRATPPLEGGALGNGDWVIFILPLCLVFVSSL